MSSDIKCPACGSSDISTTQSLASIRLLSGSSVRFEETNHVCHNCKCEGDMTGNNSAVVTKVINRAAQESVQSILTYLWDEGLQPVFIERALRLPIGTITEWRKSGRVSPEGIALLSILKARPELVYLADNNFEEKEKPE